MATEKNQKGFENREAKNEFMNCFPIDEKTMKLRREDSIYAAYRP